MLSVALIHQVAPTWLSPAPCPMEPRRSSATTLHRRGHPACSPPLPSLAALDFKGCRNHQPPKRRQKRRLVADATSSARTFGQLQPRCADLGKTGHQDDPSQGSDLGKRSPWWVGKPQIRTTVAPDPHNSPATCLSTAQAPPLRRRWERTASGPGLRVANIPPRDPHTAAVKALKTIPITETESPSTSRRVEAMP